MNILICGDSFAADYSMISDAAYPGWPQILGTAHNVTNVAQAGCSEYKIYLQLQAADVSRHDAVIIWHTSPFRIYVKQHPYLDHSSFHRNSDLIYHDIMHHDFDDKEILKTFFEKYFDLDHAKFVHTLMRKEIAQALHTIPSFHLGIDLPDVDFDATDLFKHHRGHVNHLDQIANQTIADTLQRWLSAHLPQ